MYIHIFYSLQICYQSHFIIGLFNLNYLIETAVYNFEAKIETSLSPPRIYHLPKVKCSLLLQFHNFIRQKELIFTDHLLCSRACSGQLSSDITCHPRKSSMWGCRFSFYRRRNWASVKLIVWQSSTPLIRGKLRSIWLQRLFPQNYDVPNVWFIFSNNTKSNAGKHDWNGV